MMIAAHLKQPEVNYQRQGVFLSEEMAGIVHVSNYR